MRVIIIACLGPRVLRAKVHASAATSVDRETGKDREAELGALQRWRIGYGDYDDRDPGEL